MKKFKLYTMLSIFLIVTSLAIFFPIVNQDITAKLYTITNLESIMDLSQEGLLSGSLIVFLAKMRVFRVIVYAMLITVFINLIRQIVNKKNFSLNFIAFFFLFLIDKILFASSIVSLTGFITHFFGTLFILLLINLISKEKIVELKIPILLILGMLGTSIYPVYSFVFLIGTLIILCFEKREKSEDLKYIALISGELIGILSLVTNTTFTFKSFISNLMHDLIPNISSTNSFISIILYSLLLFEGIKQFSNGNKFKSAIEVLAISLYMFALLLSNSCIILYITYILFLWSSYHILSNIKNSMTFKKRIDLYYLFIILYIVISAIVGNTNISSVFYLKVFDIIFILEVYSKLLPNEFMNILWFIVSTIIGLSSIYIYKNTYDRYEKMNIYIKHKLECNVENFRIPNRFKTDNLYDYLPTGLVDLENYIKYYDIKVYGDITNVDLNFEK